MESRIGGLEWCGGKKPTGGVSPVREPRASWAGVGADGGRAKKLKHLLRAESGKEKAEMDQWATDYQTTTTGSQGFRLPTAACVLCSAVRPNRSVSRELPMQPPKADRIMAGQNHAERKTGGQSSMILSGHDSVVSGCGFAALCSFERGLTLLDRPHIQLSIGLRVRHQDPLAREWGLHLFDGH
jgi:hypothetical protein